MQPSEGGGTDYHTSTEVAAKCTCSWSSSTAEPILMARATATRSLGLQALRT